MYIHIYIYIYIYIYIVLTYIYVYTESFVGQYSIKKAFEPCTYISIYIEPNETWGHANANVCI